MKIKKGDNVIIIKGKDRNKSGKAEKILVNDKKIVINGLNIYKKHIKPSKRYPHGGIVDVNIAVPANNVMVICPRCSKPTRIGYSINKENKLRICKKCKESLDVTA